MDHGLSDFYLDVIRKILKKNCNNIDSVALFGSRATGHYRPESDIDFVIYGDITEQENDHLYTCFLESTIPYKVDLTAYNHITYPPLKKHIDKFSKTLFTRQELYK